VQLAAIDLAALLVRAAGNIMARARASEAPEGRTQAVDRVLLRVEREIATRAQELKRDVREDDDVVGHHLARALRVPTPARVPNGGAADRDALDCVRDAWLRVAALEHGAVAALDAKVPAPVYRAHYATLGTTITETGANHLCGARLITRADAFRHQKAWRAQSTALSSALEMYINGLPGASDGPERTQGILLTRLVRAAIAITLIDLRAAIGCDRPTPVGEVG
jgi:hypothetical protein